MTPSPDRHPLPIARPQLGQRADTEILSESFATPKLGKAIFRGRSFSTMSIFRFLFLLPVMAAAFCGPASAQGTLPVAPAPVQNVTPPPLPPEVPAARSIKVFYAKNGQTFGPFDAEQLKAKIAAGEVNRQTLVWMEGMDGWKAAATVSALAPLLAVVPPEQQFDAAAFQVGTWQSRSTVAASDGTPIEVTDTFTYRPDGTLIGFGTWVSQTQYGPFVMNISSRGRWTTEVKDKASFIVKLNLTNEMSTPNAPPTTRTVNVTSLLTIIDRNTVADQAGNRRYRTAN